jgi:hypothetical protein
MAENSHVFGHDIRHYTRQSKTSVNSMRASLLKRKTPIYSNLELYNYTSNDLTTYPFLPL